MSIYISLISWLSCSSPILQPLSIKSPLFDYRYNEIRASFRVVIKISVVVVLLGFSFCRLLVSPGVECPIWP